MAVLAAVAGIAGAAHASTVHFVSNPGLEGLGAFTGSMNWTYLGDSAGTLVVTLTNTSPVENGGYLTGFVFNAVHNVELKVLYDEATPDRDDVADVNAHPLGIFDHGAAIGGDWLGGGQPWGSGVGVGQTFAFTFDVRGQAELLSTLVAHDFFDESDGWGFAARFRGFDDDGSDKVTASLPAPGAAALLGLGALASRRRRR
jgi:MYXO-CTERM domain-containing protein